MIPRVAVVLLLAGACLAQGTAVRMDQVAQSFVASKVFMGSVLVARDGDVLLNQSDHISTGRATLDAVRDAANRWIFPDAGDKWDGVAWEERAGTPKIEGTLIWLACELRDVHDGGDHTIATGRVLDLEAADGEPLLFYEGEYQGLLNP